MKTFTQYVSDKRKMNETSEASNDGKYSASLIEKFKSKEDAEKAASFYVSKFGYGKNPSKAADFIEAFMKEAKNKY